MRIEKIQLRDSKNPGRTKTYGLYTPSAQVLIDCQEADLQMVVTKDEIAERRAMAKKAIAETRVAMRASLVGSEDKACPADCPNLTEGDSCSQDKETNTEGAACEAYFDALMPDEDEVDKANFADWVSNLTATEVAIILHAFISDTAQGKFQHDVEWVGRHMEIGQMRAYKDAITVLMTDAVPELAEQGESDPKADALAESSESSSTEQG
jgi:hypothetical protein